MICQRFCCKMIFFTKYVIKFSFYGRYGKISFSYSLQDGSSLFLFFIKLVNKSRTKFAQFFLTNKMSNSEIECTPPELRELAKKLTLNLVFEKSKLRYQKTYKDFRDWCESNAPTGRKWFHF
jgi:hypothetical protein